MLRVLLRVATRQAVRLKGAGFNGFFPVLISRAALFLRVQRRLPRKRSRGSSSGAVSALL